MNKILCLVCAFLLAGCSAKTASASPSAKIGGLAGVANPWGEGSTLQEAVDGSGVAFEIHGSLPFPYDKVIYRWMSGTIEVRYFNGDQEINLRKSSSKEIKDISGDYNVYTDTKSIRVNDRTAELSGKDKKYNKAVFESTEAVYSITVAPGTSNGLDEASMISLITAMK